MKNNLVKCLSFVLSLGLVFGLAACGGSAGSSQAGASKAESGASSAKTAEKSDLKVGFVCSASGANDNGYNKAGVDMLESLAKELGFEFNVVEPTNGVPQALETLAEDGYNLIFSLEYDFDALIKGVGGAEPIAAQYPDTRFVIFNDNPNVDDQGKPLYKNVIAAMFNVNEASYLAGYLAVQMNEHQKELFPEGYKLTPTENGRGIGFIGGTDSPGIRVYSYGYMMGINAAAEEYGVEYDYYAKYDAGFVDPALGSTTAGTMFADGANVVFADCGVVGDGITAKAKEEGKLSVQTDANLDAQQPGHVITSVLKITSVPVEDIVRATVDGSVSGMDNLQNYDIASGATGITDLSEIGKHVADQKVWEEITAKINTATEKIKSGEIKIVNAQIGEEFDPASTPRVHTK